MKVFGRFLVEVKDPSLQFDLYNAGGGGINGDGKAVQVTPLFIELDNKTMLPKELIYRSSTGERRASLEDGKWCDFPD